MEPGQKSNSVKNPEKKRVNHLVCPKCTGRMRTDEMLIENGMIYSWNTCMNDLCGSQWLDRRPMDLNPAASAHSVSFLKTQKYMLKNHLRNA